MGYSPWGLKESDMTEQLHYGRNQYNIIKQFSFQSKHKKKKIEKQKTKNGLKPFKSLSAIEQNST